jgi:hypothetical protein
MSPITDTDPQPQTGASLIATNSRTSQTDNSTAPPQLIRPELRSADSGTTTKQAAAVAATRMPGIQNSQ